MHASDSLYDYLVRNLPSVHLSRLKSVFMAVDSLLKGGQLSLTALGRSAVTATTPKHNIKRIDRLLGNDKLYNEIESFCRAMTGQRNRGLLGLPRDARSRSSQLQIQASLPRPHLCQVRFSRV